MENYVKVSKDVFAPIVELVRIGLFRDEKDALVGIIREQARNKIWYYEGKISELKRKYKVDFLEFKRIIEERKDEEVFEEWDDFIRWESYEEALRYWTDVEARV
ncbi:MAG: hypothetical protein KFBDDELM_00012 [Candidatus Argoarchaeum ethanivorans]|uniref:Uncharacterized protein n=1 Tax=Candidatus Argoarchaeum ethanivorans TaxID=2608793 RepID=A0A811T7T3_9EURY|nr:MAG: hypothetical protein KFBDDELM_00012 [Candidatus Argoarchaeum ethanivorans]CAD6491673.1 MAG: hypothetical protein FFODKBPE_00206 [Candidatus Argoarchaeum ethanivorans]